MNNRTRRWERPLRAILPAIFLFLSAIVPVPARALPEGDSPAGILPVDQVRPGMKGEAKTVFAGSSVQSFGVEVLGLLRNLFGPQQHIILVRLTGPQVEYTGVVAGMSGSPVYLEGRLAGALSLRFGSFTKEAIAGVTPIADMLRVGEPAAPTAAENWPVRYSVPDATLAELGLPQGTTLVPIETPLTLSGFFPQAIPRLTEELGRYGFVLTPGGSAATSATASPLEAGGAVSAALVTGDLTLTGTCTITLREGDRLYACGHPLLGFGNVEMPMTRAEVVTTVASQAASFKIANAGEIIGSFTQDRRTAIVGTLGTQPPMIPVELTLVSPASRRERTFRFDLFQHPRLTSALLGAAIFNGLVGTTEYGEETSYRVSGRIDVRGHPSVLFEDMVSPSDAFLPDALVIANQVSQPFARVFTNPFELPDVQRIQLRLEMIPERQSATIENAWSDKAEVAPGELLTLKVVIQPYRGPRRLLTVSIQVPLHTAKGDLRVLVSDANLLNRLTRSLVLDPRFAFGFTTRLTSLDQLITTLNRERRNDHLYVSLFQRSPTLLVQDKVLPSVPLSQMNVLGNQTATGQQGGTLVFYDSILGETSERLGLVVTGSHWLQVQVR